MVQKLPVPGSGFLGDLVDTGDGYRNASIAVCHIVAGLSAVNCNGVLNQYILRTCWFNGNSFGAKTTIVLRIDTDFCIAPEDCFIRVSKQAYDRSEG